MKKINYLLLSGLLFTLAGCSQDDIYSSANSDGTANVTLNLGYPGFSTRAYSDGKGSTKLQYGVYEVMGSGDTETMKLVSGLSNYNDEINMSKSLTFKLVTDHKYRIVFWASSSQSPYTITWNESTNPVMTVNYEGIKANDETLDGFFKTIDLDVKGDVQMDVELKRPFAQLNVGTSDFEASKKAGCDPQKSSIKVTTKYNTLDLVTGKATKDADTNPSITFTYNDIAGHNSVAAETFPVEGYDYLAMAYILMDQEEEDLTNTDRTKNELVDVTFNYNDEKETEGFHMRQVGSVPLKRNYRTNIYGQILTSTGNLNVIIEPNYDDNHQGLEPDNLKMLADIGGTLSLEDDVELEERTVFKRDAVINLNGKTVTGPGTGNSSDDGAFIVGPDANLVINGPGKMMTEGTYASILVWASGGTVTINGGTFESINPEEIIYIDDIGGTIVINGGTFKGKADKSGHYAILNIHGTAVDNGTGKFIVKGGSFYNWDPSNNTADGPNTNYVAPGYESVKTEIDGETWYMVVPKGAVVAETQEDFNEAVKTENATIQLSSGDYTFPAKPAKGLTIIGNGETVFPINDQQPAAYEDITFKNIKYVGGTNYRGLQHSKNLRFQNCEIQDLMFGYADGLIFDNCTFTTEISGYNIWTYTANNVEFNNCVFNCAGKCVHIYNESPKTSNPLTITFNNCKFFASKVDGDKAAIQIGSGSPYNIFINGCTADGFSSDNRTKNSLWNHKEDTANEINVTVNGKLVYTNPSK